MDPGGADSESDPGSHWHRGVGAALPAGPASGGRGLLVNATRALNPPVGVSAGGAGASPSSKHERHTMSSKHARARFIQPYLRWALCYIHFRD